MVHDAVVLSAARSPIGSFIGGLADLEPQEPATVFAGDCTPGVDAAHRIVTCELHSD